MDVVKLPEALMQSRSDQGASNRYNVWAFDVGGSTTRGALLSGGVVSVLEPFATPNVQIALSQTPHDILSSVVSKIRSHVNTTTSGDSIVGVSFAGLVRNQRTVVTAPDITGSTDLAFEFARAVEEVTGLPCVIINDLAAAAWRYRDAMQQQYVNRYAVLTISTGIGYYSLNVNEPQHAGEDPVSLGHHPSAGDGPAMMCTCGETGHITATSSGIGVQNLVTCWALNNPDDFASSTLLSIAERHQAVLSDSEIHERVSRRFHRLNAFGLLPKDISEMILQEPRRLTVRDSRRYLYPLLLDSRDFVSAIDSGDSAANSLFHKAVKPIADHLAEAVLPCHERVILMGGLVRAMPSRYLDELLYCLRSADRLEAEKQLYIGEVDDLDGVLGVAEYIYWTNTKRGVIS